MKKKKIVILASGNGTNAENIARYFKENAKITVSLIISNRKHAKVLERAKKLNIESFVFNSKDFLGLKLRLQKEKIDLIVLAGFLALIPPSFLVSFKRRVINLHPSLLPKFGGKGMYGMAVHRAVHLNKEKKSGITVHYVNEEFDKGEIIFQAECSLKKEDAPEEIAKKIHTLEYTHFPKVIAALLQQEN